ncbi:UDP-N-acetylglucosamine transporter [Araneus ventricosus]|uniref:UDP-N-acetylglucosamine transporter n=1 Tax=Araneus ventricosus TaxID=182803 RepID=A0A4Y2P0R4_ARAVE|nr:UDP-N-acetylglucosamine transporter [Araneus ventricosus]
MKEELRHSERRLRAPKLMGGDCSAYGRFMRRHGAAFCPLGVEMQSDIICEITYSRTVPQNGPRYLASTTILISEILKIVSCLAVLCCECGWSLSNLKCLLIQEIWRKPVETLKLIVPAFLYTVQNNLLFIALSVLDAATYQVTYQLKILTTAMFSVMILHKRLVTTQWLALVLLMIGVALVQVSRLLKLLLVTANKCRLHVLVLKYTVESQYYDDQAG